jgi:hypothetical protein
MVALVFVATALLVYRRRSGGALPWEARRYGKTGAPHAAPDRSHAAGGAADPVAVELGAAVAAASGSEARPASRAMLAQGKMVPRLAAAPAAGGEGAALPAGWLETKVSGAH